VQKDQIIELKSIQIIMRKNSNNQILFENVFNTVSNTRARNSNNHAQKFNMYIITKKSNNNANNSNNRANNSNNPAKM
jgi:hypothetical protein